MRSSTGRRGRRRHSTRRPVATVWRGYVHTTPVDLPRGRRASCTRMCRHRRQRSCRHIHPVAGLPSRRFDAPLGPSHTAAFRQSTPRSTVVSRVRGLLRRSPAMRCRSGCRRAWTKRARLRLAVRGRAWSGRRSRQTSCEGWRGNCSRSRWRTVPACHQRCSSSLRRDLGMTSHPARTETCRSSSRRR